MLPGAELGRVAPTEAPRKLACCFSVPPKAPQTPLIPLGEGLHAAGFPLMDESSAGSVTGGQNRTSIWKTVIVTEACSTMHMNTTIPVLATRPTCLRKHL